MSLETRLRSIRLGLPAPADSPASPFDPAPAVPLTPDELVHSLSPLPNLDMTPAEEAYVEDYQFTRLLLGSSISCTMVCATTCPRITTCPLAIIQKAPYGHRCPLEMHHAKERFLSWTREFGAEDPRLLTEAERVAVGQLVQIDVQEQRLHDQLAIGENTKLVSRSVNDVDTNGVPICYEDKTHIHLQTLELLDNRRQRIFKQWELTPEARSKKMKGVLQQVVDLSSKSADASDRFRQALLSRKK